MSGKAQQFSSKCSDSDRPKWASCYRSYLEKAPSLISKVVREGYGSMNDLPNLPSFVAKYQVQLYNVNILTECN